MMQRTVVVEFESLDAAIACHDSAAYQEALAALGDGVTRDMRVVEGLATSVLDGVTSSLDSPDCQFAVRTQTAETRCPPFLEKNTATAGARAL